MKRRFKLKPPFSAFGIGAGFRALSTSPGGHLTALRNFGTNPGALKAWVHIPEALSPGAPLVVALHGCRQSAAAYDHGAGWSRLADDRGFALLCPEQGFTNNVNRCFNWFRPEDTQRGAGEAHSIKQMIDTLIAREKIDPKRVYVTGLSAGGAMTAALLATYPEVFAGGAIIAGVPYGTAQTVSHAILRMRGVGIPAAKTLQSLLRQASPHKGPWPTISIWHGTDDRTVDPANAAGILDQWRAVHHLKAQPSRTDTVNGRNRRVWCNASGRELVEDFSIAGMGHGVPLDPASNAGGENAGAFMLDARISSTQHIASFWQLVGRPKRARRTSVKSPPARRAPVKARKTKSFGSVTSLLALAKSAVAAALKPFRRRK